MLKDLLENKKIEARGIVGFYPCSQVNEDDVEVYDPIDRETKVATFHMLRQQLDLDQDSFVSMADFIAPKT